jgi:gliding motility-associated-like protein
MCTEIINPADGDRFVSVTANITWIRDFGASGYQMTIEEKSIGGVKILDSFDVGNGTNFKPPDFMGNTLYFVTIRPYNDLGVAPNCQPISFTTGAAPLPPVCARLSLPEDGSVNVPVTTDLSWTPVTGAIGYVLSVGTTTGGTDIVENMDITGGTTFNLNGVLPENTRIYVSVTPYSNAGLTEGCNEMSFTTESFEDMTEFVPVPRFFTPNNDGVNDLWIVSSPSELPVSGVWIFNRFGQLLKQMEGNSGWDGTFNGRPLASGSYWYRIAMEDGSLMVGFFTLKR